MLRLKKQKKRIGQSPVASAIPLTNKTTTPYISITSSLQLKTIPMTIDHFEQRVQAMFFRWGAASLFVLLLGFVGQGFMLTWQVQSLEPRIKVMETQLHRSSRLIDRLDEKIDVIRNEVTRIATQIESTSA